MRQAVFVNPGLIEWRETAEPRLEAGGEALVRPIVVGRCDLDVAYMRGVLPMASGEPIGHEIIAEIVEPGTDLGDAFKPGDRVFVPAQISCGECASCRAGMTGRCRSVPFAASYGMGREGGYGGGLADLVRVPFARAMLTPVPNGADPISLIGLADMARDAWRGVAPGLARMPGARVLVLGGMPAVIGLYAAGIAVSLGASDVVYVDLDDGRVAVAAAYGARRVAVEELGIEEFDIVFVANPARAALDAAVRSCAPGGVVTSATPTLDGTPSFDTLDLYRRGLTWTIGRPDCRGAACGTADCWANAGFDPALVRPRAFVWDDAPAAWVSDDLYACVQSWPERPSRSRDIRFEDRSHALITERRLSGSKT